MGPHTSMGSHATLDLAHHYNKKLSRSLIVMRYETLASVTDFGYTFI